MNIYTDDKGIRHIELGHYSIRVRRVDAGAYCINAGQNNDSYLDDVVQYITAVNMDEEEIRALGVLSSYLLDLKAKVIDTLDEINKSTNASDSRGS